MDLSCESISKIFIGFNELFDDKLESIGGFHFWIWKHWNPFSIIESQARTSNFPRAHSNFEFR